MTISTTIVRAIRVALLLGCGFFWASAAKAQVTYTWTGGGADSNWNTAANWSGGVPGSSGNTVLVFAGSTRTSPNNNLTD